MSKINQENIDRLSQNQQITQQLTLVFPKNLILFIALIVLAALLLIWAFIGRIPTEISGRGVAMSSSGIFLITSDTSGTISEVFVEEGDEVQKNDPLGMIYNPNIKSTLVDIEATEFTITQQKTELKVLKSEYQTNLELFGEGLISKLVVDQSQAKVFEQEIALEKSKSEIDTLFSKLQTISPASIDEIHKIRALLLDGTFTENLDPIEAELSLIRSPEQGKILEVYVNEGDHIDRKEPLFWLEYPMEEKKSEYFYSTTNADVIGRLRPGMRVLIEPLIVDPQNYGSMIGKVKEVFSYPVSEQELFQTIGNKQIVSFLLADKPAVTYLLVEPILDPNTKSGFKWTSKKGPPYSIPTGSVANLKLVIEEQPPISYLIPMWKIRKVVP